MPAKICSRNRIKPRFLKGYRRNGALAREGIDTTVVVSVAFSIVVVEMELQPERALQSIKF